ncbi:MAG: HAD hydrolase family protein [Clostridia bacterium]|nr:HAD hydrolase family protein [Clostridia bacterium]
MKKIIAFDLDGTLTQHRTKLNKQNRELLFKLKEKYDLVMIGAGDCKRIYNQMEEFPINIIGNYGMQESTVVNGEFKLIKEEKYEVDRDFFNKNCDYLRKKYGYTNYKGESIDFHVSGMVTFALLGVDADINDKVKFDPTREKRKVMYKEVLEIFKDYTVFIGGSSSFDISKKQYNKYDAFMEYAKRKGYTKDEMLFVGDDFGDGGGDSHIRLGGIDYVFIENYENAPKDLEYLLK